MTGGTEPVCAEGENMIDPRSVINFRERLVKFREPELALDIFKECQPKLLVVTDNLSFQPTADFGLTQFVQTLATSPIHGILPKVIKASRGGASPADLSGFKFDDPTNGLLKSRYDVVFILGFDGQFTNPISQSEIDAIATFMQAGGGVFATGDHEDLGAAISKSIPRVREMRFWTTGTPNVANAQRLSTNMAGSNEVEDFNDQSDLTPQNLYPNFRTAAGNPGLLGKPAKAHPLLQLPATASVPFPVLEVFPDHPHEGECRLPASLTTHFSLGGAQVDEWPTATTGARVTPEIVAVTMSHGSGFQFGPTGPKEALLPRSFISICAYDGQLANVGRVVTDATWHHFVNVNLDGGSSGLTGLQNPGSPPTDSVALQRIRQYYRNLATWLMPKNTRRCLKFPHFLDELVKFPLFEEAQPIPIPGGPPGPGPDPAPFVTLGEAVVASLATRYPAFVAEEMLSDALSEAVGEKLAREMLAKGTQLGKLGPQQLAYAALGGIVSSTLETLSKLKSEREIKPHQTFDAPAATGAKTAVRLLVEKQRQEIRAMDELLKSIEPQ
jgi:hypothetical protein